jgi:hypothetical protein
MGGSSSISAGCMADFDFELDLVDHNERFLLFTYERIRRLFPDAAKRVRLFHGDLPSYVSQEMMNGGRTGYVVHHQVVRDMASLSFVRDKLYAIIAQDTQLRGAVAHVNFVDMALYAVFGLDLKYAPIGCVYDKKDSRTAPNSYRRNYFMSGAPEGIVLPMSANSFRYPHPRLKIEDFLPAKREPSPATAA